METKIKEIDIICFSGTGNTNYLVKEISNLFIENNIIIHNINTKEKYIHEKGRDILLAFPINSQSVSPYIYKHFKKLPNGCHDRVHVLITLNNSCYIINSLKKILIKKDYLPIGVKEISMPNNFLLEYPVKDKENQKNRVLNAINDVKKFGIEIINHQDTWKETKKGSSFVSFLSRKTNLPWFTMRLVNKLEVDETKCIKCNKCINECPVSNIVMQYFPKHLNKCQFCMHCIANCPNNAIRFKGKPNYHVQTINDSIEK